MPKHETTAKAEDVFYFIPGPENSKGNLKEISDQSENSR